MFNLEFQCLVPYFFSTLTLLFDLKLQCSWLFACVMLILESLNHDAQALVNLCV
jgi:hypothetical protein